MIVVRIMGGLGNQMFQYAAGRRLAERNNTDLVLDLSWFDEKDTTDTQRSFELDDFNIRASIADRKLMNQLGDAGFSILGRLKTGLVSAGKYHKAKFYEYGYDNRFENLKDDYYIKGYFQSEKYFVLINNKIRQELSFKNPQEYQKHPLYKEIRESVSVSLHVRRGDYRKAAAHSLCSEEYYQKAVTVLQEQIGRDHKLVVFSDDPDWVRQEINFPNAVFVNNSDSDVRNIDLFLMSACQHHIIANSTYSWLAAWLNPSDKKIVLAPEGWTREHKTKDIDLYFDSMQIIE